MKLICSEHGGLIEVLDSETIDALRSSLRAKVLYCPVCEERVLIYNIEIKEPDIQTETELT